GPRLVQLPRGDRRRGNVVAALNDHPRDVSEPVGVPDQLALLEEAFVDEVVVLDPGEGEGIMLLAELIRVGLIGKERNGFSLPEAPGPRGLPLHGGVLMGKAP